MKVTIEVKDCRDCPYKTNHRGHGECWTFCDNEKAKGYPYSILWGCSEHYKKTPTWCPIKGAQQ